MLGQNGTLSWSDFPALPLPVPSHQHFCSCLVQLPHPSLRTAPNYAIIVEAADTTPISQAGMPETLQDMVQLLLEIWAEIRDLSVRVTTLERHRDAASPLSQLNQPQSVLASSRPQPVSASVQLVPDNQPQSVPARTQPQPVSVPVQPSPQSAPDSQPKSVPANPQPCQVQPPLPPAPTQPLSVLDCMPPQSGSSSTEADLVLDSHDMDADEEEEWAPRAPRTFDQVQADLAAMTEELIRVKQIWLSQVGSAGK
ncbi:hypothetical protein E2C01_068112 [Portunus trituberculatus]|uniref:Uncharacterized protein n=1 Tax=Portunus trituberculatus TaxID=210409 RepID=A0A5B7HVF3_PORTR|nr:hypothetical protein [Portunus trituberculatus]